MYGTERVAILVGETAGAHVGAAFMLPCGCPHRVGVLVAKHLFNMSLHTEMDDRHAYHDRDRSISTNGWWCSNGNSWPRTRFRQPGTSVVGSGAQLWNT